MVEKVNPGSGPTFTLALVKFKPDSVNELGPALVFKQTPPNQVKEVAAKTGEAVVKDCCDPYPVPPPLVA